MGEDGFVEAEVQLVEAEVLWIERLGRGQGGIVGDAERVHRVQVSTRARRTRRETPRPSPQDGSRAAGTAYLPGFETAARMTQTWPGANIFRWPEGRVNVVPASADGRDQRTSKACPFRSTTALPEPTLTA